MQIKMTRGGAACGALCGVVCGVVCGARSEARRAARCAAGMTASFPSSGGKQEGGGPPMANVTYSGGRERNTAATRQRGGYSQVARNARARHPGRLGLG